jgi:uroporphyrinogen decarboxylase
MNSRERTLLSLDHKEPDRIPFDLGGTVVTGINIKAYRNLRRYLDLPKIEPEILDIFQQIVKVDNDVLEKLNVDVKNISPRSSSTFKMDIKDSGNYWYFYDEFQIGWRMPKDNGLYYDMFEHPLAGSQITAEDVAKFDWPNPTDPSRFISLREAALKVRNEENRAVVVSSMSSGIMEVYAWTRSFQDYFSDFAGNPSLSEKFMDRILEIHLAYWDKMFDTMGDIIDVVVTADDFAGQQSMLISPTSYRKLAKPRHKELFDFIHKRSNAKIFFHSCGSIRAVIPDLIEIGCDILNPVQVSAKGMDSAELKREFGKDITFWGGGVDTQRVLGEGTPMQVREDVKRRLDDLMPGGGFIFSAVHNIQGNVPAENLIAMWETLQEFGDYQA